MLPLTKLPQWLDAVNELEFIMKNTFMKKINKSSKRIVKKTNKFAKKNPVAAVGIGSAITGIAATAITATTIKSAKHGFAAIAAKRAASAAANNTTAMVPATTTANTPAPTTTEQPQTNTNLDDEDYEVHADLVEEQDDQ